MAIYGSIEGLLGASGTKWAKLRASVQSALKSIVESQMELLRLSLYVATQGPAVYQGENLRCTLSEAKLKTSQHIAMGAGQSVNTILKCAEWRGIPVRDIYPIARSSVESFINAAFLLVEDESAAERAVRWVKYRAWKEVNRAVGSGEFTLRLSSSPDEVSLPAEFAEFTANGASREWSTLDTPSRIRRVGEIVGKKAGSRLLGAYAEPKGSASNIFLRISHAPSPTH